MSIALNSNKTSGPSQVELRIMDLRIWMIQNNITFVQMGKDLGGVTSSCVWQLLKRERISTARHRDFLNIGVPERLLPPPRDVSRGPKPKTERQ